MSNINNNKPCTQKISVDQDCLFLNYLDNCVEKRLYPPLRLYQDENFVYVYGKDGRQLSWAKDCPVIINDQEFSPSNLDDAIVQLLVDVGCVNKSMSGASFDDTNIINALNAQNSILADIFAKGDIDFELAKVIDDNGDLFQIVFEKDEDTGTISVSYIDAEGNSATPQAPISFVNPSSDLSAITSVLNQILGKKEFDLSNLQGTPICVEGVQWFFVDIVVIDNDTGAIVSNQRLYKQGYDGNYSATVPTGEVVEGFCSLSTKKEDKKYYVSSDDEDAFDSEFVGEFTISVLQDDCTTVQLSTTGLDGQPVFDLQDAVSQINSAQNWVVLSIPSDLTVFPKREQLICIEPSGTVNSVDPSRITAMSIEFQNMIFEDLGSIYLGKNLLQCILIELANVSEKLSDLQSESIDFSVTETYTGNSLITIPPSLVGRRGYITEITDQATGFVYYETDGSAINTVTSNRSTGLNANFGIKGIIDFNNFVARGSSGGSRFVITYQVIKG